MLNFVQQRLANLHLTPEKYSELDLHDILNALCFIRDSEDIQDVAIMEKYIIKLRHCRENDINTSSAALKEEFNIE